MLLISLDSLGIRLSGATGWDVAFWLGSFQLLAMLLVVRLRTGRSLPAIAREQGLPMAASGALQTATVTCFILSVTLTNVANTVVILAAGPVAGALISRAAIGERTAPRTWAAIAASLCGVSIVVSGSLGGGRLEGDLLAVGAILAIGSNLTLWRRHPELDRFVAVGLGGLGTALVALPFARPFGLDPGAVAILAAVGLLSGSAGRVAVAAATRHLPVTQVGLFAPVETVAASAWAWLFLSETPPATTLLGGAIVVGAVLYGSARSGARS